MSKSHCYGSTGLYNCTDNYNSITLQYTYAMLHYTLTTPTLTVMLMLTLTLRYATPHYTTIH